jgi:hypothetical protein
MLKHTTIAVAISALSALGLYRYRRLLLSRLLKLPPVLYEVAVERDLRVPMHDATIRALPGASPRS